MKITKCDNHPDQNAVATYRIIKLPTVGMRPLLIGSSIGGYHLDLCKECVEKIPIKVKNGQS